MLQGSETPRLFTPPARPLTRETSRGFEAIAFAEQVLGIDLFPWQKWLLIAMLELREDGRFRFRTVLLLCARQNGKTTLMQILALWRMYLDGADLVLGTAQNLTMAEETWDATLSRAEDIAELAEEIEHVSRVNGNKFVRLTTGQRYKVTAATRRGGRGNSADLVFLDELREHQDYLSWGAVTKTTMARPNAQILGFSNAGDAQSVVLADLREKALASAADRTSTLGIFEWSAPEDCALDDPAGWCAANPALGHLPSFEDAVRSALETDPEDVYRTEVLCQWVTSVKAAIPAQTWLALADGQAKQETTVVFALDVAPDHSTASIAVGWKREDGQMQVQLADHRDGTDWIVGRAAELTSRWKAPLYVSNPGTGAFLLPNLAAVPVTRGARYSGPVVFPASTTQGVKVEEVPRSFYVDACAALEAAVTAGQVRHGNQAELNTAVAASRWTTSGDAGQRVLNRKDSRVSPLVAATLALHALSKVKPRPGRFISF